MLGTHTTSLWSPRCHGEFIARSLHGRSIQYHLYPDQGLDSLIGWEGEKAGEGGVLHLSVHCQMLPGTAVREFTPSLAVVVKDYPCGLARGFPEKNFRLPVPTLHCICCTLSRRRENRGRKFVLRTFFQSWRKSDCVSDGESLCRAMLLSKYSSVFQSQLTVSCLVFVAISVCCQGNKASDVINSVLELQSQDK